MRWLRRACFACFCILLLAIVIAVFDIVLLLNISNRFTTSFASCQMHPEILPQFACNGPLARGVELFLNLPLLFIYAPLFTLTQPSGVNPGFMLMLYPFDLILVLGLAWPLLKLRERRNASRALAPLTPLLLCFALTACITTEQSAESPATPRALPAAPAPGAADKPEATPPVQRRPTQALRGAGPPPAPPPEPAEPLVDQVLAIRQACWAQADRNRALRTLEARADWVDKCIADKTKALAAQ